MIMILVRPGILSFQLVLKGLWQVNYQPPSYGWPCLYLVVKSKNPFLKAVEMSKLCSFFFFFLQSCKRYWIDFYLFVINDILLKFVSALILLNHFQFGRTKAKVFTTAFKLETCQFPFGRWSKENLDDIAA